MLVGISVPRVIQCGLNESSFLRVSFVKKRLKYFEGIY